MNRPSTWASLAIGVYLLLCRFLVGGSAEAIWSAYLTGSIVLLTGAFALALPRMRGVFAVRIVSGAWLLLSPFVLAFGGAAAVSAWVAGALLVATGEPLRALFAFAASARIVLLAYGLKALSPHHVSSVRCRHVPPEAELLGRRIVECCVQIRATMLEDPSETEIEACSLGYRACAEDMVTLTALIALERPKAGVLRRLRLWAIKGEAREALVRAQETLPNARSAPCASP